MKVYNQDKTFVLTEYDLSEGYLQDDKLVSKIIPSQEEVAEQFHYEYKEYENGGKDRIKIVDKEYRPARPETYEYEEIQIFIPYTEQEKAQIRIEELKSWFENEYSYKEQKYRRLLALDKADDDGIAAEIKLRDLYLEAEEKRKQIQELGG